MFSWEVLLGPLFIARTSALFSQARHKDREELPEYRSRLAHLRSPMQEFRVNLLGLRGLRSSSVSKSVPNLVGAIVLIQNIHAQLCRRIDANNQVTCLGVSNFPYFSGIRIVNR